MYARIKHLKHLTDGRTWLFAEYWFAREAFDIGAAPLTVEQHTTDGEPWECVADFARHVREAVDLLATNPGDKQATALLAREPETPFAHYAVAGESEKWASEIGRCRALWWNGTRYVFVEAG